MKTHKAVKKRDKILQAAAKVVAAKGYAETTLAEIGEVAGTFAGSLYYYFPSKEALLEEVLNIGTTTISEPVIARVEALPANATAWQKIKTALDEHVEQMLVENDFITAYWKIVDQVLEDVRDRHRRHPRAYGDFWRALMREGQGAGIIRADLDPNLAQLFLLGTTIYALDWYNPRRRLTPQQISDQLADMFFRGIARPEAQLESGAAAAAEIAPPKTARVKAPRARRSRGLKAAG